MTIVEGFELIKEENLPEINSKGKLYRHIQTGAELLSLENDDENKVFGITFRTPPFDSTGSPHILEHSVLGGSRKYPVKEPFVQLVKGSLNTFLNAFTYPDKTCYPVASQNLQDFYNLVDVYLDAVFYPLLSPNTFKQEGWHYELDSIDAPLTFKGVVFNEMKGAYSSPESVLEESVQRELFPDSPYRHNSGGDPVCIPDLTYEAFKKFHALYYHPSNARLYFYGDDDPGKRLQILNTYLKEFKAIQVNSDISLQKLFDKPRSINLPYEVSEADNEQKNLVAVSWLLIEVSDPELRIGLNVLNHILIGTPASPLRVALIESGLGEDLVGPGLMDELRQLVYSTGLKGVSQENASKVEPLILSTLLQLATKGIEHDTISASMNTIEFALRENNTGNFPRGLAVMLRSLGTWLYDGDPFSDLRIDGPLNKIKQRLADGEHYFENLIADVLIKNPHRLVVTLEPDPTLSKRRTEEEQSRLDQARAKMSPADLKKIVSETASLKKLQETPDTAEALATIPFLSLSDLDRNIRLLPKEVIKFEKNEILYHDLFTNGILYFDIGLNLHALPQEWLPYISLFGRAITEMGTEEESYVQLLQRIGRDTGGIHDQTLVSQVFQRETSEAWLFLRGKSMAAKSHLLMGIMSDILVRGNLDNQERFKQMALEEKASVESSLVNGGHRFVNTRLRSSLNEAGAVNEQMAGISYLYFLRDLVNQIDQDWPKVSKRLKEIRARLVNRNNIIVNVTLDRANWEKHKSSIEEFIKFLPREVVHSEIWLFDYKNVSEGMTIPSQINFVGKAGNIYDAGYKLDGSILAIMQFLNTTWIWDKVRVQGGAYGGFAVFDQFSGVLAYLSYRDPNLFGTIQAYDQTPTFLRQGEVDQSELVKSIIGAIGDLDSYQLPDAKGFTSLVRHILGVSDEWRQNFRNELLETQPGDFKKLADAIDSVSKNGHVVVIGSADAINKANIEKPGWLATQKLL